MARLKSRTRFPPRGFCILHPEAGMKQAVDNLSFSEAVAWEMKFRRQNPHLVKKFGWPTDQASVEIWVDEHNAARCLASGWIDWVDIAANAPASTPASGQKKTSGWGSVVGVGKRVVSGGVLLADWLGHGGKPVERALAEARATVCAGCPLNSLNQPERRSLLDYFTVELSERLQQMMGLKHDLDLHVAGEDRLGVCTGCDCPLPLKVWAPMVHINRYMAPDTRTRLDPRCWVLKESV